MSSTQTKCLINVQRMKYYEQNDPEMPNNGEFFKTLSEVLIILVFIFILRVQMDLLSNSKEKKLLDKHRPTSSLCLFPGGNA